MRSVCLLLVVLSLITYTQSVFAQKEATVWYFGSKAGIDFSSGSPVALTNGNLVTNEGCASICDKTTGQLLFYTDGSTVWNRNRAVMPNGTGLLGNSSSTQSAVAVPMPGNGNKYYIFTVDAQAGVSPSTTGFGGLAYSIVDMTMNSGLGDLAVKNLSLLTKTAEKLTAVRHCNGRDIWVVVHQWNSNAFYAYLVTPTGISPPVITNVGLVHQDIGSGINKEAAGYMKFSPDGKKLAVVMHRSLNTLQVFDFDNNTGVFSNPITDSAFPPNTSGSDGIYGTSFSPDNSKLYVSHFGHTNSTSYMYQYNMLAGNGAAIISSKVQVVSEATFGLGGLQIGPDGKIYVAKFDRLNLVNGFSNYLDVINNPNALGAACNYSINGFSLGIAGVNQSTLGLPDIVESFLIPQYSAVLTYNGCAGSTSVTFVDSTINGTITSLWNFGDPSSGLANTSTETNALHTYAAPGVYTATLYLTNACKTDTLTQTITIGAVGATITVNSHATCGLSNGSATANPTGGNSAYTYAWSNAATGASVSNLGGGTYTVTVTSLGCSATASATITSTSAVTFTTSVTDASCTTSGSASVTTTGGTGPFIYQWSNVATTSTINNLTGGAYQVTVTGAGNCSATASVTVNATGTPVVLSVSSTNTTCGFNNGTARVTVTSGTATAYAWSNQAQTDSISGLGAGTYTVTVTGVGGCTATATVTVNASSGKALEITSDKSIMCSGDSARICAPPGFPNYRWNNNQTGRCIAAKQAGNYYVTASDNNGCSVESNRVSIAVYPAPSVSIIVQGDTLSSFGAISYHWYFNGSPIPGATSSTYIAGEPGNYAVQITDANGCKTISNDVQFGSTAINPLQEFSFRLYPNPVQGILQLETGSEAMGIVYQLYDALGQLVHQGVVKDTQTTIDVSEYPSGIYFFKLSGSVRRVLKQ